VGIVRCKKCCPTVILAKVFGPAEFAQFILSVDGIQLTTQKKIAAPHYTHDEIQGCIALLEGLLASHEEFIQVPKEQRQALLTVTGKLSHPDKTVYRLRKNLRHVLEKQNIDTYERAARAATGIRAARTNKVFAAPQEIPTRMGQSPGEYTNLINGRSCYVCKIDFKRLHFFYDSLCPSCAELNYSKRFQTTSLKGRTALITGSRVKIGYQSTLKLLRSGAEVIATTRFPMDSALRFSQEADFGQWKNRLHIYGLDLRHTPSVELFCTHIEKQFSRLDILINNAAQTVRRPPGYYAHLIARENYRHNELSPALQSVLSSFEECKLGLGLPLHSQTEKALRSLPWQQPAHGLGLSSSAQLSQIPYTHDASLKPEEIFPDGQLDSDLQQVDLRKTNTWRQKLGEIPTAELIEIQLVNAIAPFVLCNKLTHLMKRDNTGQKHIVNVSAMEGKFDRYVKTDRHPHTNMAKAALNMLTHTSAKDLVKCGIFMNSVDTGWVTDEDPAALSSRKQEVHDFQPPLDIVDGAARVCDPFFNGILTGTHFSGQFLKDYFPVTW
jgi:NAD(P)-dependent dehydrogenase (short-subunit alcohol dehydrogenase family)